MAFTVLKSHDSRAVIRAVATQTATLSDLGSGTTAADIVSVYWCGTWVITRNSVTVLSLSGSGYWNLSDRGMSITDQNTSSIVATLTGAGTLILEVAKRK